MSEDKENNKKVTQQGENQIPLSKKGGEELKRRYWKLSFVHCLVIQEAKSTNLHLKSLGV